MPTFLHESCKFFTASLCLAEGGRGTRALTLSGDNDIHTVVEELFRDDAATGVSTRRDAKFAVRISSMCEIFAHRSCGLLLILRTDETATVEFGDLFATRQSFHVQHCYRKPLTASAYFLSRST